LGGVIRRAGVVGPVAVDLLDVALHLVEQPLENLAVRLIGRRHFDLQATSKTLASTG
jgi:hypothetical protein